MIGRHKALCFGLVVCAVVTSACSKITAIDVCQRRRPADVQVNRRTEGNQYTTSLQAIATLPTGQPFVVYTSQASGAPGELLTEIRATMVDSLGQPVRSCEADSDVTMVDLSARVHGASFAAAVDEGSVGALVFARTLEPGVSDDLSVSFVTSTGCPRTASDQRSLVPPSLIESGPAMTSIPAVFSLGGDRFVAFWTSSTDVSALPVGALKAWVFEWRGEGDPAPVPTELDVHGGVVELAPAMGSPRGLAAVEVGEGELALLWLEYDGSDYFPFFAVYSDRLELLHGPFGLVDPGSPGTETEDPVLDLALGWDGTQLLALWTAIDPDQPKRVYGRFVTKEGLALRGSRSPDAQSFRIGSSTAATESAPAVLGLGDGGFFVAWNEGGDSSRAGGDEHLRALLLTPEGDEQFANPACDRADFAIRPRGGVTQSYPVLHPGADDSVLVLWTSTTHDGTDVSGTSLRSMVWHKRDLFPLRTDP